MWSLVNPPEPKSLILATQLMDYIFCIMLQEKQETQPLKVFWEKDVFLKIAALTVARWNCTQNTWKIPIKRFIFSKAVIF